MSETPHLYDVVDYTVAAVLSLQGATLDGIRRDPPTARYRYGRTVFSFADRPRTQALHQDFLCGRLRVDPQRLLSMLKQYRQLIYNTEPFERMSKPSEPPATE